MAVPLARLLLPQRHQLKEHPARLQSKRERKKLPLFFSNNKKRLMQSLKLRLKRSKKQKTWRSSITRVKAMSKNQCKKLDKRDRKLNTDTRMMRSRSLLMQP